MFTIHNSREIDSQLEWIVNSATGFPITLRLDYFTTYKACIFGRVKMVNGSYANIVGVGDVTVQTNVGYIPVLRGV